MSIRSTVKALLMENGRLLLNQCRTADGQTYYDLPGGGQHLYETMEEAVAREVLEETGIPVEVELFAGLVEEITTDPALRGEYPEYSHRVLHIFRVRRTGEALGCCCEKDLGQEGSVWVTPEEADQLPLRPQNLRGHISELLSSGSAAFWGTVKR